MSLYSFFFFFNSPNEVLLSFEDVKLYGVFKRRSELRIIYKNYGFKFKKSTPNPLTPSTCKFLDLRLKVISILEALRSAFPNFSEKIFSLDFLEELRETFLGMEFLGDFYVRVF